MAKRFKAPVELSDSTVVTVVAESDNEIVVKDMPYGEAKALLKRKNKFKYKFYQQGYCAVKPKKKNESK